MEWGEISDLGIIKYRCLGSDASLESGTLQRLQGAKRGILWQKSAHRLLKCVFRVTLDQFVSPCVVYDWNRDCFLLLH